VIDIVFSGTAQHHLELDMIKSPTILTRRGMFRAGVGLAVAAMATPLVTPAPARAEDARQGASRLRDRAEIAKAP
jgi:hypothetical protein